MQHNETQIIIFFFIRFSLFSEYNEYYSDEGVRNLQGSENAERKRVPSARRATPAITKDEKASGKRMPLE